jgi:hypothetical protein
VVRKKKKEYTIIRLANSNVLSVPCLVVVAINFR